MARSSTCKNSLLGVPVPQIVTASSSGENADDVYIVKDVPLPAGSSIEVMSGNKIILEAGDVVKAAGSNGSGNDADVILSIMEIT